MAKELNDYIRDGLEDHDYNLPEDLIVEWAERLALANEWRAFRNWLDWDLMEMRDWWYSLSDSIKEDMQGFWEWWRGEYTEAA